MEKRFKAWFEGDARWITDNDDEMSFERILDTLNTLEAENAELKRDNSALRLVAEKAAHELKELDNELTESIAAVSDLMDEYADLKKRLEIAKAEGAAEDREACAVMCEAIGQEEERGDNPWLGSVLGAFWKHAARNIRALIPKEATDE